MPFVKPRQTVAGQQPLGGNVAQPPPERGKHFGFPLRRGRHGHVAPLARNHRRGVAAGHVGRHPQSGSGPQRQRGRAGLRDAPSDRDDVLFSQFGDRPCDGREIVDHDDVFDAELGAEQGGVHEPAGVRQPRAPVLHRAPAQAIAAARGAEPPRKARIALAGPSNDSVAKVVTSPNPRSSARAKRALVPPTSATRNGGNSRFPQFAASGG